MSIRIVVVDDHPVVRAGTISILQRDSALVVVGEADDGERALALCRELRPDLLLLDLKLPTVAGTVVARTLKAEGAAPRILVLSAMADGAFVRATLEAGADGYVLKSVSGAELCQAVHRVMAGEQVLLGVDDVSGYGSAEALSPQELLVLGLVAEGLTNKEIARRLNTGLRTVETYLTRIFRKLLVSTRTEALAVARRQGILDADGSRL